MIGREETVDVTVCPDGHILSEKVPDSCTTVVKVMRILTENVLYAINRRWCRICKKLFSARPPGVAKHARRSTNHQSAMVALST